MDPSNLGATVARAMTKIKHAERAVSPRAHLRRIKPAQVRQP